MSRQQHIIELRNEIKRLEDEVARLKAELTQEGAAYIEDALAKGIRSEDFGNWRFQIQRSPAELILDPAAVPGIFFRPTINRRAVRQFLIENGAQPWGSLGETRHRLIVKSTMDKYGEGLDS